MKKPEKFLKVPIRGTFKNFSGFHGCIAIGSLVRA